MKLTLRNRIYFGILPLLLLFLGILYFLILDVRGLYRDTQDLAYTGGEISQSLNQIEIALSSFETLLDGGDGFRARDRDMASLSRLSVDLGKSSEKMGLSASQTKLGEVMFDAGSLDANLKQIQVLASELAQGKGDPRELFQLVKETRKWTGQLRTSVNDHLHVTKKRIESRIEIVYYVVISGMVLGVLLTLCVSTFLWKRIIHPIEVISSGMEQIDSESGELSIDYAVDDELGRLARSLEAMTARLKSYQELTSQKLVRSTSAMRSILDQSPDAFFIFSEALSPIYFSPAASELYSKSSLKNKLPTEIEELLSATFESDEAKINRDLKDAIRINVDGEERWYLVHAFPFDAPDTSNFSYGAESGSRSIAAIFQEATVLKLSDSLRKNLVATVSHELKTPITSARMSLYLLLEQQIGELNEDQIVLLETARDDVNRQLATIEHLLDLSRIEEDADELRVSEFPFHEIVDESIQAHQEIAASSKIALRYEVPAHPIALVADKEKLRIVLNNFLVNAIKYGGEGSGVSIRASEGQGYLRVEVEDDGPGMDEDAVRTIFDAYTRGGGVEVVKGTGLGLKIAKDIIDAHKGQIGCQSKLGEGSTFFFEIPLC